MNLGMYTIEEGKRQLAILDSYECRCFVLDYIDNNKNSFRRCYDGMFNPSDSALSLLQVLGIDSFRITPKGTMPYKKYKSGDCGIGFTPTRAFCYDDEFSRLQELVRELEKRFPYNKEDENNNIVSNTVAKLTSYKMPESKKEYLRRIRVPNAILRKFVFDLFPQTANAAYEEVSKICERSFDELDEKEIRKASIDAITDMTFHLFDSDNHEREISAIVTCWILSCEKHVVSGLKDIFEDPFVLLCMLLHRKETENEERIMEILKQDLLLRGYMATYIRSLLYGYRSILIEYDDYLYDLYANRMWELFACHGKDYVRAGQYENLARLGMIKMGYHVSFHTIEDTIEAIHHQLLDERRI